MYTKLFLSFFLDYQATGKRSRKDAELDSGPILTSRRNLETGLADSSIVTPVCSDEAASFQSKANIKSFHDASGNNAKLAGFLKNCKSMNNLDL